MLLPPNRRVAAGPAVRYASMMRTHLTAILIVAALALSACSGRSSTHATASPAAPTTSTASSGSPSAPASPAHGTPTAAASPLAPGDTVDVTGVVGTVTTDPKAIEITRLSGADVNRIEVEDSTDIRAAGGGRIDFSAIKTSDRIIAEGRISDRGDALVATQITVSAVVPGAQPGG